MALLHLPRLYVPYEYAVEEEEDEAGELLHTDEHPFCPDPDCGCHNDENVAEHIDPYLDNGTMSNAEAFRTYFGK